MNLRKKIATATITAFAITGCATDDSRPSTSDRPVTNDYQDGDYTADGWYGGQPSRIGVTITLADNVITDVGIRTYATDPTSLGYQKDFADAIPTVVVGKNLDEVDVSRVAGASGCSEGFNSALEEIKSDAAT